MRDITVQELAHIFVTEVAPAVERHGVPSAEAYALLGPHIDNLRVILFEMIDDPSRRRRWIDMYVAKALEKHDA